MYKNRGFNGTNNAKFMSSTMKFNENDVANRFKNYIINTFNIKHETVTKLDKSRVKQLYFQQFPTESQTIDFMQIMTQLKTIDKVCDEINGYLLWGGPELIVNYLMQNDIGCVKHTNNFLSRFQHFCHTCNMGFENGRGWKQHLHGRKHQINQFKMLIMKFERTDLVKDKDEVQVTSVPLCDLEGNINVKIEINKEAIIPFYIKIVNHNYANYTINPLYENKCFDYNECAIKDSGLLKHDITFKAQSQFGHHFYPIFFKFDSYHSSYKSIYILRLLNIDVIGELHTKLVAKEEYKKKELLNVPITVNTIPGVKLKNISNCSLNIKEFDLSEYKIPISTFEKLQNKSDAKSFIGVDEGQITRKNYINYFKSILYAEEYQLDKDIRYYDMKEVKFNDVTHDVYLNLNVPTCIENRPAIIVGDRIYIYKDKTHQQRYEAIVHEINNGFTLKLGVSDDLSYINGTKYDIEFTYDKTAFVLMHKALDKCHKNFQVYEKILFPEVSKVYIKSEYKPIKMWFDKDLNDEQKKAVMNIISGTSYPAPFILYGPPGTGKTVTLVEAIKQIWRLDESNYIIACASNNLAADIIAERLIQHVDKSAILRLYNRTRDYTQIPAKIIHISNFDQVKKEYYYHSALKLKNYRIIVCSIITYGRLLAHSDFNAKHVTHLFIDEAAQTMEPELLIPIVNIIEANPNCKITLAGDPQQLSCIIHSSITKQYGLDKSLLERLMMTHNDAYCETNEYLNRVYDERYCVKLLNNYRSHRSIIEIPKKLFYDGILNECAGDFRNLFVNIKWPLLPNKAFPCIFHPVYGKESREGDSPSYFNIAEIETINMYLSELLDNKVRDKKLKFLQPSQIGIITPYRGQTQKIKQIIKEKNYGNEILVGSPEEFQGQERCVIIISSVRSIQSISSKERKLKLGFLNNSKRFNVSITRAQALLIVIGNPFMLKADECWETFLKYLKDNKSWVNFESGSNINAKTANEYQELTNLFDQIKISKEDDDELSGISETTLKEHLEWTKYD